MSPLKKSVSPSETLAQYENLVAFCPGVERKGATHPYTSCNGHMFSCLHPDGSMSLRLPGKERDEFLKKYDTTLFEVHGIVQKEYVRVPASLLKNTKELYPHFHLSWLYVQGLKPKPSKKKSS
jgi:hypothetical protein